MEHLYLAAPLPTSPYDRVEIIFHGEKLTARPIEFLYDDKGMPMSAIKFETVNPATGQMTQFLIEDLKEEQFEGPKKSKFPCPFIDPIEKGIFLLDLAHHSELMSSI